MFSKSIKEHVTHVRTVLQTLRKERLYANMEKYLFGVDKLVFLGFVVSSKGVHVDESKLKQLKFGHNRLNCNKCIVSLL